MKKIKLAALLLTFVMLFCIGAEAAIVPPDSPDASAYIAEYSAKVINGGSGVLKVSFDVTATATMADLGATAISIYKSNGTYVTTMWWFDSGRSGMMGTNRIYHGDMESLYVGAGSYYAVVTFYARNSSGGAGTKTYQTGTRTIT